MEKSDHKVGKKRVERKRAKNRGMMYSVVVVVWMLISDRNLENWSSSSEVLTTVTKYF